jgi:hypothetical protein
MTAQWIATAMTATATIFISGITWDLFDDVEWPNGFDFYISSFVLCQPETIAAFRAAVRQNYTNRRLYFTMDSNTERWEDWEDAETRNELLPVARARKSAEPPRT